MGARSTEHATKDAERLSNTTYGRQQRSDSPPRFPVNTTGRIPHHAALSGLSGKLRQHNRREKRVARNARRIEASNTLTPKLATAPRQVPKTIENQRVRDETHVKDMDEEVVEELAHDEFAKHFSEVTSPKVMITTSRKPSGEMFRFLENIFSVVPNAYYHARRAYHVQEVIKHAVARGFTDLLVFNENRKFGRGAKVNGLLHVHLPVGPSCLYRLSSLALTKTIRNHGRATKHHPELILNNFSTRLGHRIGRMLISVFPQRPELQGRRVVTFHNQRDFIFFRHHRYIFELRKGIRQYDQRESENSTKSVECAQESPEGRKPIEAVDRNPEIQDAPERISSGRSSCSGDGSSFRARLQELGPRFTLKLLSVQKGVFDSKHGEYEYVRCRRADGNKLDRRKFVL